MKYLDLFPIFIIKPFFFISCTQIKNLSIDDQYKINAMIDSMQTLDQKNKYNIITIEKKYRVDVNSNNGKILTKKLKKEKLGVNYDSYKRSKDSLREIFEKTNNLNTERLIDITEKYGYPGRKRISNYTASALSIFINSNKNYFSKIREIIAKEYKAKRISEYEKDFILWHVNGRKTTPPIRKKNNR